MNYDIWLRDDNSALVQKNFVGDFKPAKNPDGLARDEIYVVTPIAHYEKLVKNNNELETEVATNKDLRKKLKQAEEELKSNRDLLKFHEEHVKNEINRANRYKLEAEKLESLNANLLRIMKERNNAKRGIKPKKTKSGYVIKSCSSAIEITYDRTGREETSIWKTVIETPLSTDLNLEQAEAQLKKDLKDNVIGYDKDILDYIEIYIQDYKKNLNTKLWTFIVKSYHEVVGIATDMGFERKKH